jgi:MoaA/NifB/PqqE/SkfB family radical SAM enzyme
MNKNSPTFCALSHSCVAIQNLGDFCSCNVNKASWKNSKHETLYAHSNNLAEVPLSYTRKVISTTLDKGVKHPSCQVCWDLEEANAISARLQYNQLFNNLEPKKNPQILIIKPGNTCNYACRMCNPWTSSSWYKDAYELEKSGINYFSKWYEDQQPDAADEAYTSYTKRYETIRYGFDSNKNQQFWDTLKDWTNDLKFIDIYGGEPFLQPNLFDVLKHGIQTGAAKNIGLRISTNMSIPNKEYLEMLSQYKSLNFSFSIDSADAARNDYIRHKGDLTEIIKNGSEAVDYFKNKSNVQVGINYTVTPLNVFYIDQDLEALQNLFSDNVTIGVNIVTTPEYDIRHLPTEIKQILRNTIKEKTVNQFLGKIIPGCDIEWPNFCRNTDKLDELRNQSFAETFPEWWELLEPYWVS